MPADRMPRRRRSSTDAARPSSWPTRLADLLPGALEASGTQNLWTEVRVRKAWPSAVGEQIAARTSVLRLRKGTLEVGVDGEAWATELRYLADELVRRLNAAVGEQVVREVVTRRVRHR